MSDIAYIMRRAREERGLTLRQLAQLVDASEAQVSTWENARVVPRADVLTRYAHAGLISLDVIGNEGAA